jgi:hypothetical protein
MDAAVSIQAIAAVLEAQIDDAAAKMLLVCIANAHNTTTEVCCPSLDRLARESGMSRRTVQRRLAELVDAGWIIVDERFAKSGRQLAYGFRLGFLNRGEGVNLAPSRGESVNLAPSRGEGVTSVTLEGVNCDTPLKKPKEEPKESLSGAGVARSDPTAELCAVLDEEHAEAVLLHFAGLRSPLTGYTARLKAQQFEQFQDPNAAAEEMIANGWHNLKPDWVADRADKSRSTVSGTPAPGKSKATTFIPATAKAWAWCCDQTGHDPTVTNAQGGWLFEPLLLDRYYRETEQ